MPLWVRIIFCLLGLVAVNTGIKIFQQNRKSRKWNITKGKILDIAVTGIDEDFIKVKYEYGVMGVKYIGTRFNISQGSVGDAAEIVKRYQAGAIVDVIYNPINPRECALVRDHPVVAIFLILGGMVFVLFGIFASF